MRQVTEHLAVSTLFFPERMARRGLVCVHLHVHERPCVAQFDTREGSGRKTEAFSPPARRRGTSDDSARRQTEAQAMIDGRRRVSRCGLLCSYLLGLFVHVDSRPCLGRGGLELPDEPADLVWVHRHVAVLPEQDACQAHGVIFCHGKPGFGPRLAEQNGRVRVQTEACPESLGGEGAQRRCWVEFLAWIVMELDHEVVCRQAAAPKEIGGSADERGPCLTQRLEAAGAQGDSRPQGQQVLHFEPQKGREAASRGIGDGEVPTVEGLVHDLPDDPFSVSALDGNQARTQQVPHRVCSFGGVDEAHLLAGPATQGRTLAVCEHEVGQNDDGGLVGRHGLHQGRKVRPASGRKFDRVPTREVAPSVVTEGPNTDEVHALG